MYEQFSDGETVIRSARVLAGVLREVPGAVVDPPYYGQTDPAKLASSMETGHRTRHLTLDEFEPVTAKAVFRLPQRGAIEITKIDPSRDQALRKRAIVIVAGHFFDEVSLASAEAMAQSWDGESHLTYSGPDRVPTFTLR